MHKALANRRFPGAQSSAKQVVANDHARDLAPGKFVWGTFPGNFSDACRQSWPAFQRSKQTLTRDLQGVNPWENADDFLKKNIFYLFKKSKY